jgi:hypothetical protein
MDQQTSKAVSSLRKHAADALRRARKLPVGHARNDLRQLAMGLLWLEKNKLRSTAKDRITVILARNEFDPLKSEKATGWLKGELQSPK